MKKYLPFIITFIGAPLLAYLTISFALMDLNISSWGAAPRSFFIFIVISFCLVSLKAMQEVVQEQKTEDYIKKIEGLELELSRKTDEYRIRIIDMRGDFEKERKEHFQRNKEAQQQIVDLKIINHTLQEAIKIQQKQNI